ncbi:hypothetical protein ACPOL_0386 [Acidisarcina polymorpha]|uniref:Uncharacterized protein n=1 Tax=Acidisarcina polymorpha TaxID=2211140 RepID=A0A2Z5FTK1_9BACT|nr:hypothetical protein ACPOL_0386 [Acidisarcina polymorpha]
MQAIVIDLSEVGLVVPTRSSSSFGWKLIVAGKCGDLDWMVSMVAGDAAELASS